ncbi:MAG: hypothetical protein Q8P86_00470 [bacterium]|nr:hypothetical protein [bacterium]
MSGFEYDKAIVEERAGVPVKQYLFDTADFIEKNVTEKIIDEDLNALLSPDKFQRLRKVLKRETITLLNDEAARK